jgi:hypothetical protein
MKVSDHLAEFHKASATHHGEMIDAHEAALQKAAGADHVAATAFHKSAISSHEKMREYHEAGVQECEKASVDSLNKLIPDRISNLVPDYPGVRAVPRAGQRDISKTDVPLEFSHLVEIDE